MMLIINDETVDRIIKKYYGEKTVAVTPLGGGFYSRVFLAEINGYPHNVVLKFYIYGGLAKKEAEQLRALSEYTIIKIPEVYFYCDAGERAGGESGVSGDCTGGASVSSGIDVLAMEYIDGVSIGSMELSLGDGPRAAIARQIVENLRAYHDAANPNGFGDVNARGVGDINSGAYEPDWKKYYYPRAESAFYMIEDMHGRGVLGDPVLASARRAFDNFDRIFYLPVAKASLIHADYNTWNILFDRAITRPVAVIDPFNCCWSDLELDLYQLTHANGPYFGLLELYKETYAVSENFELKNAFYELFTEMAHHYNARQDVPMAAKQIPYVAALNAQMDYFCI